jgi:tRNA G10  N-methylase Trm11
MSEGVFDVSELVKQQARDRYLSNPHNDPEKVEEYILEKLQPRINVINISRRLLHDDALDFLAKNAGRFDHIVTDPPYGINMDNLEQENQGMVNINMVRDTHITSDNLVLLDLFIRVSFDSLKETGFLVFWCDMDNWNTLCKVATEVGFAVQRWPITWVKTHVCMNSMSQFNFTKTTEIAMVCRKKGTNLVKHAGQCHILACHDEFKDTMLHPFVKPFAVWDFILDKISYHGQTICDPFAGEGSGVISALRANRNVLACELVPEIHANLVENVKSHFRSFIPNVQFT